MVRHKNRYMLVEITQQHKSASEPLELRPSSLFNAITAMVQKLHGDFGLAALSAGLVAKYCNEKTRIAIIRCRHGPHRLLASCLPFVKIVEGKLVKVNTLYVGATIKNCFKFIQKHQQKKFDEYCIGLRSNDDKLALKEAIMHLEPVLSIT